MNDKIHWLLESMNQHLYGCDAMQDEVVMWRIRFLREKNANTLTSNFFLSTPSQYFKDKNVDQIFDECRINKTMEKNE